MLFPVVSFELIIDIDAYCNPYCLGSRFLDYINYALHSFQCLKRVASVKRYATSMA